MKKKKKKEKKEIFEVDSGISLRGVSRGGRVVVIVRGGRVVVRGRGGRIVYIEFSRDDSFSDDLFSDEDGDLYR